MKVSAATRALIAPDELEHYFEAFRAHRLRMGDARTPRSMVTLEIWCQMQMSARVSASLDSPALSEDAPKVIAPSDAADLVSRHPRTIRRWVKLGRLSWVEAGGVRGFLEADLLAARDGH